MVCTGSCHQPLLLADCLARGYWVRLQRHVPLVMGYESPNNVFSGTNVRLGEF